MSDTGTDYPYIRSWGELHELHHTYVDSQLELARAEGAPPLAIYRNEQDNWITFEEVKGERAKEKVAVIAAESFGFKP